MNSSDGEEPVNENAVNLADEDDIVVISSESNSSHEVNNEVIVEENDETPVVCPDAVIKNPKNLKRDYEDESELEPNKKQRTLGDDDDEGKLCPICLDVWSNMGEHRVCCLKCGHLFGHNCVTRWLRTQMVCPTCKAKVKKCDIRFIYVKRLIAADNSEIVSLSKQVEESKRETNLLRTQLRCREGEIEELQKKIKDLSSRQHHLPVEAKTRNVSTKEMLCSMEKSLQISASGGCRVMAYGHRSHSIAISVASPNVVFAGYGIREISVHDCKPLAFIPAHNKPIRDLAFHEYMLLSVALDKKAVITDMHNHTESMSFNCENALWSCCWDALDSNMIYLGEARGTVCIFDVRQPRERLAQLPMPDGMEDCSPVVSLASVAWQGENPQGELLCCKLNSCWRFDKHPQQLLTDGRQFPLEGPFTSLRYNHEAGLVLVSARPNHRHPYTRHSVLELIRSRGPDEHGCSIVHTYRGAATQSMLSRSCLLSVGPEFYAAAYHESDRNVTLWSIRTRHKTASVPAHSTVMDLCAFKSNNAYCLATLNDKKIDLFHLS